MIYVVISTIGCALGNWLNVSSCIRLSYTPRPKWCMACNKIMTSGSLYISQGHRIVRYEFYMYKCWNCNTFCVKTQTLINLITVSGSILQSAFDLIIYSCLLSLMRRHWSAYLTINLLYRVYFNRFLRFLRYFQILSEASF